MSQKLKAKDVRAFQKTVYGYYKKNGRALPWRTNINPYRILVSEVMLQQTQVSRVIPKYKLFLKEFPTLKMLSSAPLGDVLTVWRGLGYNRRAKNLKESAKIIQEKYNGRVPRSPEVLQTLPGIGYATASSIVCYAWNIPSVFIETNVRSIFLHHFFNTRNETEKVYDKDIMPLVEQTLDTKNSRIWYWALMDYGTNLKKMHGNPNVGSVVYAKQSPFKTSNRYIRGQIVKLLVLHRELRVRDFIQGIERGSEDIQKNLNQLEKEGMVKHKARIYSL